MLSRTRRKKETPENNDSVIMLAHSSSAARDNARNIPLIIGREYKARVQKRAFVVATAIIAVLIVLGAFLPTIIEIISSGSQTKIAVLNQAGDVTGQPAPQALNNVLNISNSSGQTSKSNTNTSTKKPDFAVTTANPAERDNLRQQVRDGKLDMLLTMSRNAAGDLTFDAYTSLSSSGVSLNRIFSALSQLNFSDKLGRAGVPQSQLNSLFSPPPFSVVNTSDEKSGRSPGEAIAAYFVAFIGVILIYTIISQYGVMVAQGAVEEKSSRVMELMINAATPFQLLIGKIIGIGLAGITQLVVVLVAGGAALLVQPAVRSAFLGSSSNDGIDVTNLSLGLLGLVGLYFVLGFLLYAGLFGAIGSLVSRQEDVQSALGPMYFVLIAAYLVGIYALQAPDAAWVIALSYVPFFSPILMLVRAGVGTLAVWEIPVTVVIMLVSILVMTWIAARIYRAGVLMYGQKPSFGKMLRLAFSR